MGCFGRTGHLQNRVSSAERVGHIILRQRIGHPLAVDYETVFVRAGRQNRFLPPATPSCGMQSLGFGLPMVERSSDANSGGGRMSEFKTNGHELKARARGVVMVMVVFHGCELVCLLAELICQAFSPR